MSLLRHKTKETLEKALVISELLPLKLAIGLVEEVSVHVSKCQAKVQEVRLTPSCSWSECHP
jgi:hypothetical protein